MDNQPRLTRAEVNTIWDAALHLHAIRQNSFGELLIEAENAWLEMHARLGIGPSNATETSYAYSTPPLGSAPEKS